MKIKKILLGASLSLFSLATLIAQPGGDPTMPPSGVPTRTMKTLDQVEARTPIIDGAPGVVEDGVAFFTRITLPGSYYLTENYEGTIIIDAINVTIDLNGMTMIPDAANSIDSTAILINESNVTIRNGFIQGNVATPTFSDGIAMNTGLTPRNIRVEGVTVSECAGNGIFFPNSPSTSAINCFVNNVGMTGIRAGIVSESVVTEAGESAIVARLVRDSIGETSSASVSETGIQGQLVANSMGKANEGFGITGEVIMTSIGETGSGTGIQADMVHFSQGFATDSVFPGNGILTKLVSYSQGSRNSASTYGIEADLGIGYQTFDDSGAFGTPDYSTPIFGFPGAPNDVGSKHLIP